MKRINIFTGHYGSGKTEIAVNFALRLKEQHEKVVICDMDIVNPYFRTNDVKEFLAQKGIRVIAPDYACTNVDIPVLPGDILSVFSDKDAYAVLDIGGDDDGAVALGQYFNYMKNEDYEMFFVLNALRPLTANVDDVKELAANIELMSRLKITGLINNTNLSYLSEPKHLKESMELCEDVAKELGLPISYITGAKDNLSLVPEKYKEKLFPIDLFMNLPFDAMA